MRSENKYELIKFEDGDFSLDVNVSPKEETVWLNRTEISLLFERDIKTISKHINNALQEECKNSTVAKIATVEPSSSSCNATLMCFPMVFTSLSNNSAI